MFVCLFVLMSEHMNLRTELPQILIGDHDRTTEMFLAWFKNYKMGSLTCTGKTQFPEKPGLPILYST